MGSRFLNKGQPPLPPMLFWEPWLWPTGKKGSFSLGGGGPGTGLPAKQSPVSGSNGHSEAQGLKGSASCRKKGPLSRPHLSQRGLPSMAFGGLASSGLPGWAGTQRCPPSGAELGSLGGLTRVGSRNRLGLVTLVQVWMQSRPLSSRKAWLRAEGCVCAKQQNTEPLRCFGASPFPSARSSTVPEFSLWTSKLARSHPRPSFLHPELCHSVH